MRSFIQKMMGKVCGWGHNRDNGWVRCIHEEFEHPFNGTNFVHCNQQEVVDNKFKL